MTASDQRPHPPASYVGASPIFAHDGNLGFPTDDPAWREFVNRHGIRVASYHDMPKLTHELEDEVKAFSYLPAANYYYIRHDPSYEAVASALYAADQTPKLTSLLVVRESSGITAIDQLHGLRLGYAHPYCTTSYFAPALLLMDNGYSIGDFFSELIQVPPYQGQIDAVVTERVDATMVQEDVWRKEPRNAGTTRVIAKKHDLPTPLIIVSARADDDFRNELTQLMFSNRPPVTPATLFSGFVPYQQKQVQEFFAASELAVPINTG
jgi:phosphonate transport system substrate-binding protein